MDFISLIVLAAISLYYLLNRRYTYWKRRNVHHIEPEFFYGNAREIGAKKSSGQFYKEMYLKFKHLKPLVGLYVYTQPVAMVTDLDLIKQILIKDFNTFPNRGGYYNEKDDPTSANMSVIEDDKWKAMRNKLTPVFTSGKIKMMFSIISRVTDRMIERIALESAEIGAIEMKSLFSRYTTDVIGEAAFGINCNSLSDPSTEFYKMGLRAFSNTSFLKRTITLNYPNISRKLGITVNDPEIVAFYRDIVQQTIKYREENDVVRNDIFSTLTNLMRQSLLTFNEVLTQSITFFHGGFETSSTVLTFAIYELSQHKDIRMKARECIAKALEKHNGEFTYEAVNDMQYLEQCVNESMRIHPAATHSRRVAFNDYHVPNTKIMLEKGTQVYIPVFGILHDPDIYHDPTTFNPDRFSPEESAKRDNIAFIPFGDGPRMCLGARFAMVEVKITLAKLLMSYDFELDYARTPVPLTYETRRVILTAASGIYVNFEKN